MSGEVFVTNRERMPRDSHFAILIYYTVHIPGDERSRTHPGHGYPASSEQVVEYRAYLNRYEWERQIAALEQRHTAYSAMMVTPQTVTTRVEVRP